MLSEEKIIENFEKLTTKLSELGVDTSKLFYNIGPQIVHAPASTNIDICRAYEGGLVEHILEITKLAYKINKTLPEENRVNEDSLIKVSMLHQISLYNAFVPINSDWYNRRGIMYEYNSERVSMRNGERTIKILMDSDIKLTDEEFQAILNYDKVDDAQSKFYTETLGEIIKSANMLAIRIFKENNKND